MNLGHWIRIRFLFLNLSRHLLVPDPYGCAAASSSRLIPGAIPLSPSAAIFLPIFSASSSKQHTPIMCLQSVSDVISSAVSCTKFPSPQLCHSWPDVAETPVVLLQLRYMPTSIWLAVASIVIDGRCWLIAGFDLFLPPYSFGAGWSTRKREEIV